MHLKSIVKIKDTVMSSFDFLCWALLTLPHSLHLISLLLILSLDFFQNYHFFIVRYESDNCMIMLLMLSNAPMSCLLCEIFEMLLFFIVTIHYFINAAYLKETNNKK